MAQRGADLGSRMANAVDDLIRPDGGTVMILGSDSPTLPAETVDQAAERLKDCPVVLGPSADGGYYLVGTTRADLPIFDRIAWGESTVLAETLRRLRESAIDASLLPMWYDVDTADDLAWMAEHIQWLARAGEEIPRRTAEFLKRL
jgi:uncharacterized protein